MAGLRQQVKLASKGVGSYGPERANCASRRQGIKEVILSKGFVLFCIEKKKKKKDKASAKPSRGSREASNSPALGTLFC